MIVGHLPFLGKLVALLITGSEKTEIVEFRFGCVVCSNAAMTKNGRSPEWLRLRCFRAEVTFLIRDGSAAKPTPGRH